MEEEAAVQAKQLPLTEDDWEAHIVSGLAPIVEHSFSGIDDPSCDGHIPMVFFQGARMFDPEHAATLSTTDALSLGVTLITCLTAFSMKT